MEYRQRKRLRSITEISSVAILRDVQTFIVFTYCIYKLIAFCWIILQRLKENHLPLILMIVYI